MKLLDFCPTCNGFHEITLYSTIVTYFSEAHNGKTFDVDPGQNRNCPKDTTDIFKCHNCGKVHYSKKTLPPRY